MIYGKIEFLGRIFHRNMDNANKDNSCYFNYELSLYNKSTAIF